MKKKRTRRTKGLPSNLGNFYMILLVPEFSSTRIKLGYTTHLDQRLKEHKTAAPTAVLMHSWKSKRSWEQAAIDCAKNEPHVQVGPEVFEFEDIGSVVARLNKFFRLMHGKDKGGRKGATS